MKAFCEFYSVVLSVVKEIGCQGPTLPQIKPFLSLEILAWAAHPLLLSLN